MIKPIRLLKVQLIESDFTFGFADMFQILWINQAIVNGSGSRACGFFSSEACFSEIDTGSLKFSPSMGHEQVLAQSKPDTIRMSAPSMSVSRAQPALAVSANKFSSMKSQVGPFHKAFADMMPYTSIKFKQCQSHKYAAHISTLLSKMSVMQGTSSTYMVPGSF